MSNSIKKLEDLINNNKLHLNLESGTKLTEKDAKQILDIIESIEKMEDEDAMRRDDNYGHGESWR